MSLVQFSISECICSPETPLKHTLGILQRGLDHRELSRKRVIFREALSALGAPGQTEAVPEAL